MGEESWMNKVVYFTDLNKLHDALENFNIKSFSNKKIPVKLHMGELKNKYFTKPDFVKNVVDELKKVNANPYLFDTTVAYKGLRYSKIGYEKLAKIHGFTNKKVGCNVVIGDKGKPVEVEDKEYIVADQLINSTHFFAISHVKAHIATGMGGAIKNFGMGGIIKETKKMMHNGCRPIQQKDSCTFCGVCSELCPFGAIKTIKDSWNVNSIKCFGCGVCVDVCKEKALDFEDADLQFVIACAAKACIQDKNVIYLNDVNRIADSCDCDPFAKKILCPDIGYLISDDIVAIDKASLDLIYNIKKDVFEKETHMNPMKQINFGEEIGLGSSKYQLIDI
jgi:uncharacterized Fe-S center protein